MCFPWVEGLGLEGFGLWSMELSMTLDPED